MKTKPLEKLRKVKMPCKEHLIAYPVEGLEKELKNIGMGQEFVLKHCKKCDYISVERIDVFDWEKRE